MAGATGLFIGDERAVKATHIPVDFEEYVNGLQAKAAGLKAWDSPWFQAVIKLRGNGAASIPRRVMRGETEIEEHLFDGAAGMPRIDLPRLMEQASIALDLYGACYFAAVRNRGGKTLEVRWLDPRTVELEYDKATGKLLYFHRKLQGRIVQTYIYDEATKKAPGLAWAWSIGMNETGPGDTLAAACDLPAKTLVMADELLRGLYQRGAINQHWVTADYNPPEQEKERLREKIRRFMFGGVSNAHNIEVFNAGLTVTKIGTDPNALELGPTADRLQNDICSVCRTPRILLNTADASNRATIDRATQTWLATVIAPHAQMIIDALNYHILDDMNYTLQLNTAGMDVDQAEEMEKAQAWAVYVEHDVNAETAAEMLGIDIPEGMEFIDAAKVAERQAAELARMDALRAGQQGQQGQGQPPPGSVDKEEPATKGARRVDHGKAYAEEIAALMEMAIDGEITAGQMAQAWRVIATEAYTAALKRGMGVKANEMLLSDEESALAGVLEREYEAIDKAVTEVFGGLTQDTGNGSGA